MLDLCPDIDIRLSRQGLNPPSLGIDQPPTLPSDRLGQGASELIHQAKLCLYTRHVPIHVKNRNKSGPGNQMVGRLDSR